MSMLTGKDTVWVLRLFIFHLATCFPIILKKIMGETYRVFMKLKSVKAECKGFGQVPKQLCRHKHRRNS